MTTTARIEESLVRRCVSGHNDAWTELFQLCQPTLLRQIASWLGPLKSCGELSEEIAGRVWLKLIEQRFDRLARFDVSRGVKLSTYLVALARNEFLMFLREQGRRQRRETRRAQTQSESRTADGLELDLADCLACLDTTEKALVEQQLAGGEDGRVTVVNRKTLNKLRHYLGLSDNSRARRGSQSQKNDEEPGKASRDDSGGGI